jgi:hypothetical protein
MPEVRALGIFMSIETAKYDILFDGSMKRVKSRINNSICFCIWRLWYYYHNDVCYLSNMGPPGPSLSSTLFGDHLNGLHCK